jgi:thymidine phosphorylase
VASILSKKATAGATHVIVDIPYGPQTKLSARADADALAGLFEEVGKGLGLHVRTLVTDGSRPIGRGVGPALEVRDVRQVLENHPDAPMDLREKALRFAGEIIAFDPRVASAAQGMRIATALLDEGNARAAFDRIVATQGIRPDPVAPGAHTHVIVATAAGRVGAINGWQISGVARAAGAPRRAGAGIDLLCTLGERVAAGEPLYRIHAESAADLATAVAMTRRAGEASTAVRVDPD